MDEYEITFSRTFKVEETNESDAIESGKSIFALRMIEAMVGGACGDELLDYPKITTFDYKIKKLPPRKEGMRLVSYDDYCNSRGTISQCDALILKLGLENREKALIKLLRGKSFSEKFHLLFGRD